MAALVSTLVVASQWRLWMVIKLKLSRLLWDTRDCCSYASSRLLRGQRYWQQKSVYLRGRQNRTVHVFVIANKTLLIHYLLGDLSAFVHTLTDEPSILRGIHIAGMILVKRSRGILGRVPLKCSSVKQQLSLSLHLTVFFLFFNFS